MLESSAPMPSLYEESCCRCLRRAWECFLLTLASADFGIKFLVTSRTLKNGKMPSSETIVCFQRQASNSDLITFFILRLPAQINSYKSCQIQSCVGTDVDHAIALLRCYLVFSQKHLLRAWEFLRCN